MTPPDAQPDAQRLDAPCADAARCPWAHHGQQLRAWLTLITQDASARATLHAHLSQTSPLPYQPALRALAAQRDDLTLQLAAAIFADERRDLAPERSHSAALLRQLMQQLSQDPTQACAQQLTRSMIASRGLRPEASPLQRAIAAKVTQAMGQACAEHDASRELDRAPWDARVIQRLMDDPERLSLSMIEGHLAGSPPSAQGFAALQRAAKLNRVWPEDATSCAALKLGLAMASLSAGDAQGAGQRLNDLRGCGELDAAMERARMVITRLLRAQLQGQLDLDPDDALDRALRDAIPSAPEGCAGLHDAWPDLARALPERIWRLARHEAPPADPDALGITLTRAQRVAMATARVQEARQQLLGQAHVDAAQAQTGPAAMLASLRRAEQLLGQTDHPIGRWTARALEALSSQADPASLDEALALAMTQAGGAPQRLTALQLAPISALSPREQRQLLALTLLLQGRDATLAILKTLGPTHQATRWLCSP